MLRHFGEFIINKYFSDPWLRLCVHHPLLSSPSCASASCSTLSHLQAFVHDNSFSLHIAKASMLSDPKDVCGKGLVPGVAQFGRGKAFSRWGWWEVLSHWGWAFKWDLGTLILFSLTVHILAHDVGSSPHCLLPAIAIQHPHQRHPHKVGLEAK